MTCSHRRAPGPRSPGPLLAAWLGAAALAALTAPTPATAQETRVAVGPFEGPEADRVRARVRRALRSLAIPEVEWERAVQGAGPPRRDADFARLAEALEARAVVTGVVDTRRGWRVRLTVREGADGSVVGDVELEDASRSRLERRILRSAADALEPLVAEARFPRAMLPEPGGPDRLIAVKPFEGPGGERLADETRALLSATPGFVVVDPGVMPPQDVDAYVEGVVDRPSRRLYRLSVRVVNGADARSLDEGVFQGSSPGALVDAYRGELFDRLGLALRSSESRVRRTPPRRAPEAAAPDEDDAGAATGPGDEPRPPALELALGGQSVTRTFRYEDDLFGALRPYELPAWPFLAWELGLHPGAFVVDGPWSHLGVLLRGDWAPGLSSTDTAGVRFDTTAWSVDAGVRGRLPVDASELGLLVGWGYRVFRVEDGPDGNDPDLPGWEYHYLRFEADGRLSLVGDLFLRVRGAYLWLLSTGDLASAAWFPRSEGGGLEGEVGLAFRVGAGLEARLGFVYRRFWFSMNPVPGDQRIAGGALDQYFLGTLGLAWRWNPRD